MRKELLTAAAALLLAFFSAWPSTSAIARPNHYVEVAVTVDDLPGMGALPAGMNRIRIGQNIGQALKGSGVPAYGFANGVQLVADPPQVDVLKEWAKAGFPIGNHTFSHMSLSKVDARTYIPDIERMDRALAGLNLDVESLTARRVFRCPYMAEGNTIEKRDKVRDYLFAHQYRIAEVTIDYQDWAWNDAYTRCLARRDPAALEGVRKRAADSALRHLEESTRLARMLFGRDIRHILLIHMGAFEAAELGGILGKYRTAGVRFISLRRAMQDPAYQVNPNYAYPGGDMTFLDQIVESRKMRNPFRDAIDNPQTIGMICK